MKLKQISSIDSHYLVKELQVLKDSRVDKIYQPEKNIIIFSFYKTNVCKKILKIIALKFHNQFQFKFWELGIGIGGGLNFSFIFFFYI